MGLLSKELIKKIRKIEIKMSRLVTERMAGQYHSVFKGQGVEFAEVRQYEYGDDIRSIDWNVTARMGTPFVKKFVEERELFVYILVDVSASGLFSTANKSKMDIIAEIAALLSFCAINNNDKIGLILFSDEVEKFVRAGKGRKHVLRLIREILYHKPHGEKTNIAGALEYLNKIAKRRSVAFLISDFIANDFSKPLKVACKKHDLVGISVYDPNEYDFEDIGIVSFEDAETKEIVTIDTSYRDPDDEHSFARFSKNARTKRKEVDKVFQRYKVDNVMVSTDKPYLTPLLKYFKKRSMRL
ncbi:DUF58 domain-containing protein [Thermodesulfobacteriota bacterium]